MSLSRRIPLQQVFLVALVAGVACYAAAMPQDAVTPYAAPSAAPYQPVAATSAATSGYSTSTQPQSLQKLYSSLLIEGAGGGSLTESVLVIPGKPMDPQAVGQAVEDLSVMSRIIEKNGLGEYHDSGGLGDVTAYNAYRTSVWTGMGPATLFPAVGQAKPMYVGGYGALFFIQVNYPLLPPPQTPPEQPAKPQEDPVWAEARRSVLEPQAQPIVPQEEAEPAEPYSGDQVDTLRSALIATLKHATNIRVLEPADWVTIVVQGVAPAPQAPQGPYSAPAALPAAAPTAGRTVLTVRVTKADVDQYAKGQLDQQQFAQRVQILTY